MNRLSRPPIHITDPDGVLIRRATRVAIVLPLLFWVGSGPLAQPTVALFAAFGSFAMLALADFGGTLPRRAVAYGVLTVVGATLVALGTLASASIPVAASLMLAVGFAVAFAGALGGTTSRRDPRSRSPTSSPPPCPHPRPRSPPASPVGCSPGR